MNIIIIVLLLLEIFIFFAEAIKCYECGFLPALPGSQENCRHTGIGLCQYETSTELENPDESLDNWEFDVKNETGHKAVCYTVEGKFRNEYATIRGCDLVPISESNECFSSVGLLTKQQVWFDTDKGREYFTDQTFCTCSEDFCNYKTYGGSSRLFFPQSWVLFVELILFQIIILKMLF